MVHPEKEEEIHQSVHETDPESGKVTFIACDKTMKEMGKWLNAWFLTD